MRSNSFHESRKAYDSSKIETQRSRWDISYPNSEANSLSNTNPESRHVWIVDLMSVPFKVNVGPLLTKPRLSTASL